MANKVFIPTIRRDGIFYDQSAESDLLFDLIRTSPYQQRKNISRHQLLDRAAFKKAQDLIINNYFAHLSPSGVNANQLVRSVGYVLPDYYLDSKNFVESLAIHTGTMEQVLQMWYDSPAHKTHLFGENKFFREQECVGVGNAKGSRGRAVYVFISCPCSGN